MAGFRVSQATIAAFAILACITAKAEIREPAALRPGQKVALKTSEQSGDYIDRVKTPPVQKTINGFLFEKEIADEMSSRYKGFTEGYEFKQSYRLDRIEDYIRYEQANKELVDWTLKKLLQYHTEHAIKRAPKEHPAVRTAQQAMSTVKAIQNSTVQITENTKTTFKYDFPSGTMKMGMTSPLVDTSVDYRTRAPDKKIGEINAEEKLTVSMTKSVKELGASSGVRYGVTNQTVNYGVTKHLVGPVSAQVDQAHYINNTAKDETIYRLNVGVRF